MVAYASDVALTVGEALDARGINIAHGILEHDVDFAVAEFEEKFDYFPDLSNANWERNHVEDRVMEIYGYDPEWRWGL